MAGLPPLVASSSHGNATTGSSYTVNLPSGIVAGNLLAAFISIEADDGDPAFPTLWGKLYSVDSGSTLVRGSCYYKIADGTEGASIAVANHIATDKKADWKVLRIAPWHGTTPPEAGTATASSSSNSRNLPSVTPSWGNAETLYIGVIHYLNAQRILGTYPAELPDNHANDASDGTTTGCRHGTATGVVSGTSLDPASFVLSGVTAIIGNTIAVRPQPFSDFTVSATLGDATLSATFTAASNFETTATLDDAALVSSFTTSKLFQGIETAFVQSYFYEKDPIQWVSPEEAERERQALMRKYGYLNEGYRPKRIMQGAWKTPKRDGMKQDRQPRVRAYRPAPFQRPPERGKPRY